VTETGEPAGRNMPPVSAEERIELVRRGFEAWDAGDVEAVLELLDPGIEGFAAEALINAGTYRGHEGFLRWAQRWFEAWEPDFRNTPQEIVAVGDRHAVARVHQTGQGRESGVPVEMTVGWVFEEREGRVVFIGLYPDFEQAMAVARGREQITAGQGDA
jgi:uncharacterized protein